MSLKQSASSQAAAAQAASLRALAAASSEKTREILLEASFRLEAKAAANTLLQSTGVPLIASTAQPPPEDAANDQEESIDTFSGYLPTALPDCVLRALSGCADESVSEAQTKQDVETIEILDSNDGFREAQADDSSPVTKIEFSSLNVPSHTSPACESALLASVTAPQTSDASAECLLDLAKAKALSPLQLEGCCLAIDRHNRLLQDSSSGVTTRAGFFIGDGTSTRTPYKYRMSNPRPSTPLFYCLTIRSFLRQLLESARAARLQLSYAIRCAEEERGTCGCLYHENSPSMPLAICGIASVTVLCTTEVTC